MNDMHVVMLSVFLVRIKTENITLNPGDDKLYSILTGDTLTLQCPVNSSRKSEVRWLFLNKDAQTSILSIGEKLNNADFQFSVNFTNHLQNVIYLRIYNITSQEQHTYKCVYSSNKSNIVPCHYNIRVSNATYSLKMDTNGFVCCKLHGRNISSNKFMWEHRTLYGEHMRFIESVPTNYLGMSNRDEHLAMHRYNYKQSCINITKNGILNYKKEGEYICTAQFSIYGRNQIIDKFSSIKIENLQDRPFCIQETKNQHSNLGTNIKITMKFYSKPAYTVLSLRKNDSELEFGHDNIIKKNISLDVYNVTVMVSGYEMIINITEFSEEDVGNYTVNISNECGYCNCTFQLLSQGNYTKKVVIGKKTRAEITKSLQWYILACGSIIVVLFAMSALRSTFLKTVDNCLKPTIRKPSCHKSTEEQATKKHSTKKQAARKPRRAYSDQFMEVTLNQLNNGERILIIGQTNETDASTETNI